MSSLEEEWDLGLDSCWRVYLVWLGASISTHYLECASKPVPETKWTFVNLASLDHAPGFIVYYCISEKLLRLRDPIDDITTRSVSRPPMHETELQLNGRAVCSHPTGLGCCVLKRLFNETLIYTALVSVPQTIDAGSVALSWTIPETGN